MNPEEYKKRTKDFALRIIRLVGALPQGPVCQVIGRQLLRSGTSVGANYRAACRGRSKAEFLAKMGIVEEECDETIYWLELLADSGKMNPDKLHDLITEANSILAITVASIRTARPGR